MVHLPVFQNTQSVRSQEIDVEVELKQNPGEHYALNAASVLGLLDALGFDAQEVAAALSEFAGARRRFDVAGVVNDITFIDDYAHHSTEIAATVKAACNLSDYKNVHAI